MKTAAYVVVPAISLSNISCSGTGTSRAEATFSDDVRTAREHELAWALRWTLSKVWRVQHGTGITMTGLLDWDAYEDWRAREKGWPARWCDWPLTACSTTISSIRVPDLRKQT